MPRTPTRNRFLSFAMVCAFAQLACSAPEDGDGEPTTSASPNGGAGAGGSGTDTGATAGLGATGSSGSDPVAGSASLGGSATVGGGGGAGTEPGQEIGGAGAGGGEAVPAGPIDFRAWLLQLPTGSGTSPDRATSAELLAGFTNPYFYIAEDGGQAFMVPKQGITTSGSTRCRTELREQNITGGNAAWASAGTHTLTVEGKVTKMGGGAIAVAQLFNSTDSIPLGELQYTTGHKFTLWYQEAKGNGDSTDLKTSVPLGSKYVFQLAMVDGTFKISINDKPVYSHKPSSGILDNQFYFKVGNYDQGTSRGTPTTTPYSIVEVYKAEISHQ